MTATNVEIVTPQNEVLIDSPENVVEIAQNDVEVLIVETIGPQIAAECDPRFDPRCDPRCDPIRRKPGLCGEPGHKLHGQVRI